ncbi:MAG: response regulator [Myxococcota bacterium]
MADLEQALFGQRPDSTPSSMPAAGPSFTVDGALQGQQGLAMVEHSVRQGDPYALAFVDIRMPPGWDGVQTTQRLWQVDPNLQVVLCTAYSDYSWHQLLDELGHTDRLLLLKKPFESVEVLQLAMALTAKWSLLREHAAMHERLEATVQARTEELAASHERLRQQMQERLEAERKTRHLQKVQALGRLCASVGHEINNPLCFVTGNLELMALDLDQLQTSPDNPGLWAEVRESLDASINGTARISEIVAAMRNVARNDHGRASRADVAKAIETATVLTRNELRHRARLSVVQGRVPPVRIGERELEQVLINLLINAGHAIPDGRAEDHEVRIDVTLRPGRQVSIEISDTGHGIEPEIATHVFDPFYTTKPVGQGTGLGLTLCREMITGAGGELTLTSEPGQGTTVHIVLPTVQTEAPTEVSAQSPDETLTTPSPTAQSPTAQSPTAEPATAEPATAEPATSEPATAEPTTAEQGKTKVLLIDDDPLILRMLQRALQGYDIRLAHGGREALERCREESFDLLVCDIMMPDLSGIEVYERLTAHHDQQAGRFLFITGGVVDESLELFLRHPDTRCVRKPFSAQSIRRAVARRLVEIG